MSPGVTRDDRLRKPLVELIEASVQDRVAAATDPDAVLGAAAAGMIAGLSYPPALQEPHFAALQGALTARLHGDLRARTGWSVAALYAGDALYRVVAGVGGSLGTSAHEIARALAAPDVPHPALAALAAAAVRYAALAASHKLDAAVSAERLPPERRAARAELRAALAGLGAPGEAPPSVLDDLTELTDGLVAALSTAIGGAAARKPPRVAGAAPACGDEAAVPLDPTLRRALARLGDVRLRILAHPRYKQGDGLWARRARLLVTLLSDALDLTLAGDAHRAPVFAVPAADAAKAVDGALAEIEPRAVGEAVAGAYALGRRLAESPSPAVFLKTSGRDLRRLGAGLLALFRGDAALLDVLPGAGGDDVVTALVSYARVLAERQRPDQADLCLLAALVAASVMPGAAAVAPPDGSRVAWALRFTQEIHGKPVPDAAVYADALRRATDDGCQAADADATLAVMAAIHDFAAGKRGEARAALDRVLARADAEGLGVPRMSYRYDEKTPTLVFTARVDVSYGAGVLGSGSDIQLGLGLRSGGAPEGSLTAALLPQGSPGAGDDAARYYVYTAALATAYHLLEGDAERATLSGQRVVGALSSGLRLGPWRIRSEKPAAWGKDARAVLVVAAQLAADAGMPFLAGDLWSLVRQGLGERFDDREVRALLDHPPLGLAGIDAWTRVAERARRSLAVVVEPLPCTRAKVELGAYEEVGCDAYPTALSLRIAGGLKKLPRLHRSAETSARCGAWKSLDTFLAGADRGNYDPDAFVHAVEDLRGEGKVHDAAVLLARHKHPDHCNPTLVAAARALGRSPLLGPALRADLLSEAVNCTAATDAPELGADVADLDAETERLPDPARNLTLVMSLADRASRTGRWEMLGKVVARPDFVARWMGVHPAAAAAALLLDHAVTLLRGQAVDPAPTKGTYQLLCETFPAPDRASICADLALLRVPPAGPLPERQQAAREAVKRMLAAATAPPRGK
jgi:hypothetical protein